MATGAEGYARYSRRSWALLGCTVILFALVAVAERRTSAQVRPSDRYRMHALPVAVSYLYLGRPHDYTGYKSVAETFHDRSTDLDAALARYAEPGAPPGEGTYFWTADDRGLADYCALAFRLFGPRLSSLADLHLAMLGLTVLLFLVGFRRSPVLWLVPVFVLGGHLFLLHAYQLRGQIPMVDGSVWQEDIAAYDSRVFEVLGALPWFHLALLAARRSAGRAAMATALPQAAILLFLLHARSTIGWEYLALGAVALVATAMRLRERSLTGSVQPGLWRPVAVLGAVVLSVLGLAAYQRAAFHPEYAASRGGRTVWHNALIGFTAHPHLRDRHRLAIDDNAALQWVIRDARERSDSRFNSEWSSGLFIASSKGEQTSFDWEAYEGCARDLYLRTWQKGFGKALKCHVVYKPKDAARQVASVIAATTRTSIPGAWGFLAAGLAVVLAAVGVASRRLEGEEPHDLRLLAGVSSMFALVALAPCIAFYGSLATMSGVYLGGGLLLGLGLVGSVRAIRLKTFMGRVAPGESSPASARRGLLRANAFPLILTVVTAALVCLLFATDRRLGLNQFASTRYRFHAIPVAVSHLYHNRPHDYTAYRNMAMRFQDTNRNIDEQIREAIYPEYDIGGGTYFWVADDRGLGDFVIGAFSLFGPKAMSLSKFYFVLLALGLLFYTIGYWRTPAALILPMLLMLGWLGIAQVMLVRVPMQFGSGWWGEEIALYESRMFDVLALVSVAHLAILAGTGARVSRLAWATAVPQAALFVFLYHARSSLGWQYLALFVLIGLRVAWWTVARVRSGESTPLAALARPLFVATLLATSLVGLKQYQRAAYHTDYLQDYGQRTFWHNALMGLAYHPGLREDLPMGLCDDRNAVDLVLARMEKDDPQLDRNDWNWMAALNSLGNHNRFDWDRYEQTARTIFFDLWRDEPDRMAECYGYYKPADIGRQIGLLSRRLRTSIGKGTAPEYAGGLALVLPVLVGIVLAARRDPEIRLWLRSLSRVVAVALPFSLIPGIAFYPALTTVACFYLLSAALGSLLAMRVAAHLFRTS